MSTIRFCTAALVVVGLLSGTACFAQESEVKQLHTVLRSETYHVMVGDLLQVRYKTRGDVNAISTYKVSGMGDVVKQIAVFTCPIDPTDESEADPSYYVTVLFKAVKQGEVVVTVTPILLDGSKERPFKFAVEAQK